MPRAANNGLRLEVSARVGRAYVPFLKKHLPRAHRLMAGSISLRDLSIALVGDRTMSALHKTYMNIGGPTDVLTFSLESNEGEIVIDVDEARRRAKALAIDPRLEVLLYAIHGMLHLCGYDDRSDNGYRAMHRMEDKLLTQLGLGPVFWRKREGAER